MALPRKITAEQSHALRDIATTRLIEQRAQAGHPDPSLMQRAGLATARLALALTPCAKHIMDRLRSTHPNLRSTHIRHVRPQHKSPYHSNNPAPPRHSYIMYSGHQTQIQTPPQPQHYIPHKHMLVLRVLRPGHAANASHPAHTLLLGFPAGQ